MHLIMGFLGDSAGKKNPPAMKEAWVWSLGWDNPLEKGKATHSSILAWRIPGTEELGGIWSRELQRVRHDWRLSTCLALGLCGVNSLVLYVFHCRYLAISILSLLDQLWYLSICLLLSQLLLMPPRHISLTFVFYGLTVILGGSGGQRRQKHMVSLSV